MSKIEIERAANKLKIDIYTSRPGIIIGRKGTEVDKLKQEIQKRTNREVFINIQEIQKPELDAQLIAESVAMQLEKRVAFRRAMRKAVESALRFGARGIKVRVSGRLNGAEIARSEWYLHGQLPLQTLRADIDYGFARGDHDLRPDRREGVALQGRAADAAHRPRRRLPDAAPRGAPGARTSASRWPVWPASHAAMVSWQLVQLTRIIVMLMPKKVKFRKQQRGRMRGQGLARVGRVVRRLRAEGARAVLADGPADRGGARGDDALHQARRQDLDSRVPGQADHEEAAGNAHGQGQGRAGAVGLRRPAGPHPVRDGRRQRDGRARSDAARVGEAADQDEVRDPVRARRRRHEDRRSSATSGAEELRQREKDLDDQLFRLRIQKSMGQVEAAYKLKARAPRSGAREDGAAREGAV